jgi:ribosomal protein S12 methylthiotransferase accessory factor
MATAALGPARDDLVRAAELYREAMPPGRLRTFDITPLDRLGVPVLTATFAGEGGFLNDGFGYGATPEEALVGALGEISETAHLDAALRRAPVEVASFDEMTDRHGAARVLDPLTLCLPAGSCYDPAAPLAWVGVTRWPDGEGGFVPLESVAMAPGQWARRAGGARCLFRPITSGLGAGTTDAMALAHGLLELLQRDGNCTAIRAMDRGVAIELDAVRDPGLAGLLEGFRERGVTLQAKLASTEFGLANLYVQGTGAETACSLAQTGCGEAVHPDARSALRKAALEFAASRARKTFMHGPLEGVRAVAPEGYLEEYAGLLDLGAEEPRALAEMTRWEGLDAPALLDALRETVLAVRETVPLSALPSGGPELRDPEERLADVAGRLAAEGLEVWAFDASPGREGPRVLKAAVPGLEGETMSYHRIGERGAARLIRRGTGLVRREGGHGRARIRLTPEAEDRLGGPVWLDAARTDEIVGTAYPLYREPSSHAVQMAKAGRPAG